MPNFNKERSGPGRGRLTWWNGHSGDSGLVGLVWTACWTASSSEGGCGWGCSGGSCFPLRLQHSSLCWGNACGRCKPEEATLVTRLVPRQRHTCSQELTSLPTSISVRGKLAQDPHPHPSDLSSGSQPLPQKSLSLTPWPCPMKTLVSLCWNREQDCSAKPLS